MLFVWILAALGAVALLICLIPFIVNRFRGGPESAKDAAFSSLQKNYLIVYGLAVAGDWLQGPHLYELYHDADIPKQWIELLFLTGFLSSLLFGTFIGGLADKVGRRKIAVVYALMYIVTCSAANFSKIWVFALGRITGGIATSILFSAFESWVIHEHTERGFSEPQLGTLFSNGGLLNSAVAVVAGIVAQKAVDYFGTAGPFNLAIIDLVILAALILFLWKENYGNEEATVSSNFSEAFKAIFSDLNIVCLGLIQALFEGVMYTYIVQWTPAMKEAFAPRELDHGYIFATFMVAVSIGASFFKFSSKVMKPEKMMIAIFLLAALCMTPPFLFPHSAALTYTGFILFEACVGIFWPSMAYLRGLYLPEEGRSTIMNIFRMPLNMIVIFMMVMDFKLKTTFIICTALLFLACLCQIVLFVRGGRHTLAKENDVQLQYTAVPQSQMTIEEKPADDVVENSIRKKYPSLEDNHLNLPLIDEENNSGLTSVIEQEPPLSPIEKEQSENEVEKTTSEE